MRQKHVDQADSVVKNSWQVNTSPIEAKSVKALIALAKAQPRKINYASAGTGTTTHIAVELFNAMAEVQMTPGQFGVVSLIGANPGLTQSALARAVGIERSTMVAVIDTLQERGMVERKPSPVDRRSYALVLTGNGENLMERLLPMVRAHERNVARNLSVVEKERLIELLMRLIP